MFSCLSITVWKEPDVRRGLYAIMYCWSGSHYFLFEENKQFLHAQQGHENMQWHMNVQWTFSLTFWNINVGYSATNYSSYVHSLDLCLLGHNVDIEGFFLHIILKINLYAW